jgi:hypothetical protein
MFRTRRSDQVQRLQFRPWRPYTHTLLVWIFTCASLFAQSSAGTENEAGYVPIISGGAGYVHNVSGGVSSLEPQIDPVLLVPFGRHVLLESRTDFTGFFQRQNFTSGPFKGKVFKDVEYAQIDWLADSHAIIVGGRYLLPFGLYNERLQPIWIRNLQDFPYTASIGTRTSGAGDGLMLRGVLAQTEKASVQYSAYFSAHSGINQLGAARTAGGDASVFFPSLHLEVGGSAQRFLEGQHINNGAAYVSWQPLDASVDVKGEFDYSHFGRGYWLEGAWKLDRASPHAFIQKAQLVGRVEQVLPLHGGGNGLPSIENKRFDAGLNYYLKDNLRLVSSYGRNFSSHQNLNVWNAGITYRFTIPLWFKEAR